MCIKNLGGEKKKKMKTKNKLLALLEIAIVLCSLFLVALPAIAAEQNQEMQKVSASEVTTASEDDYVLGVYGNANEDDTIDMRDLTYVKLIFFGKKPETELADAKYDGKINPLDFIQIKLIIVGKEKELTIVDSADRIVTVRMPVERAVLLTPDSVQTIRSLKLEKDRIVGLNNWVFTSKKVFYPEFQDYPNVGSGKSPDIEKILSLTPDIIFEYASLYKKTSQKLEEVGLTVICFDLYKPESYVEEVEKLGYIIGKKEETDEFLEFYKEYMNTIKERVEDIPEDQRARVYFESTKSYKTCGKGSGWHQKVTMAGGNNIFSDLSGYPKVDPEEVMVRNPESIIKLNFHESGYGVDNPTGVKDMWNELMNRTELENIDAVKNKKVYVIAHDIMGGPSSFIGIGYMAKWFYPDLSKDINPKAVHQEYLTRFQGFDFDLDKQGVFVYPEPN